MKFEYDTLAEYVEEADKQRSAIITKCREEGYIVPSDDMRKASGLDNIRLNEIILWMIKRQDAIILAKTIETNEVYLDSSLKTSIPDLEIQWEYDPSRPFDNIVKIKDITQSTIKHTYSSKGIHTIALFSPSKLDKVASYCFNGNINIKEVTFTPVIETIDSYSFYNTSNLDTVNFNGDNVKCINSYAFYNTALSSFTLPDSVEVLYGSSPFNSSLSSFKINYTTSNLKKIIGTWIFSFMERASNDDWIDIPSNCKFYINETTEITNESEQKIQNVIDNWNPFSKCFNRINIHGSQYVMNDKYGITYLKDKSGNPLCILHIPQYDIFDDYKIPSTVKYISHGSFISIDTTKRKIPITIPQSVEYIHPYFIHYSHRNFKFSSNNNNRYKTTSYGGLMTYSDSSKFGKTPDVLLYEPQIYASEYSFPSDFNNLRDFRNKYINVSGILNINSTIEIIKINKSFPKIINDGNSGPFANNPKQSFQYLNSSCDNYTIYNGSLYMTDDTGNKYGCLIGVPKNVTSFNIHSNCKWLYFSTFGRCTQLTGNLNLNNIIYCGYQCFYNTKKLTSIEFGNELTTIDSYMTFYGSGITTLYIGTSKDSKFTNFGGGTVIFADNSNLTNIWIYSTIVSNISKVLIQSKIKDIVIHIYFYNIDGTETTTYKTFKKVGYSANIRSENGVILKDIGIL